LQYFDYWQRPSANLAIARLTRFAPIANSTAQKQRAQILLHRLRQPKAGRDRFSFRAAVWAFFARTATRLRSCRTLFIERCTKESARVPKNRNLKTSVTVFRRVPLEKAERIDQRSILRGKRDPGRNGGQHNFTIPFWEVHSGWDFSFCSSAILSAGFAQARSRARLLNATGPAVSQFGYDWWRMTSSRILNAER